VAYHPREGEVPSRNCQNYLDTPPCKGNGGGLFSGEFVNKGW
jgi:hypothetical protein